MDLTGKEKCWMCRRTAEEIHDYMDKIRILPGTGFVRKWLVLDEITPLDLEGDGKINEEDKLVVCPFCREAIFSCVAQHSISKKD